jgi:hypothetical protein
VVTLALSSVVAMDMAGGARCFGVKLNLGGVYEREDLVFLGVGVKGDESAGEEGEDESAGDPQTPFAHSEMEAIFGSGQ